MRRSLARALTALLALGCQTLPPPTSDRGQLLVELEALPREGIDRWRPGSSYDAPGAQLGPAYERVDYRSLPDMIVVLAGASLDDGGPVPRETSLKIEGRSGGLAFDHRQILLGPRGLTRLWIENATDRPLSLYTTADHDEGFDLEIAPEARAEVTLTTPGHYQLRCAEAESLEAEVVVSETTYARTGRSGESIFFDHIPPGDCVLTVLAPRLPPLQQSVAVRAGERVTISAQISVNTLPRVRSNGSRGSD
jgi:hypothetical protein